MKFTEEELGKIKKERMEQIDRWLDNEYGCSYTRLEELHDFAIEQDMKHQEEKDKEIERITNELEREKSKVKEYGTRMLKAIEILEKYEVRYRPGELYLKDILLDILQGKDR